MSNETYKSLSESLMDRASRDPEALALVLIADNDSEDWVTVGRLHRRATAYAHAIQAIGVAPNDVVIIALRHSLDLIAAFWGTLYLGAVPTIFPYRFPRPDATEHKRQVRELVNNSGAEAVVIDSESESSAPDALGELGARVLVADTVKISMENEFQPPGEHRDSDRVAYLQYTSGTTGLQKGVVLSHRGIQAFVLSFAKAGQVGRSDVTVSWLPLFHDYGLFAGLVFPLLVGVPTVLMSPFKWIRSPKTLLWAIHRHRGTICWMPNSAHNHAVRSVRERDLEGLDLSSLRLLASGGEPVLHASQQMFLERFAPYGFKEAALAVGYGMAENTLAATTTEMGRRPSVDWVDVRQLQAKRAVPAPRESNGVMSVVSCGRPVDGADVMIVDETEGRSLPERGVGEVAIRSTTLFSGYHRRPDLAARSMRDGWYYTGDLGYMAGGELYVCGRKKDLIIVGAKNIYPHDLEAIANSISGVYPDRSVAFGVMDEELGSEKIVMVCDLRRSLDQQAEVQIERALRKRVLEVFDVTLGDVRLFKKGWVVKTPNGKVSRAANRQKYEALTMSATTMI